MVQVFCGLATQWVRAGMTGIPSGLRYEAIPVVAGAHGIPVDAWLMDGLQTMETEVLACWDEQRRREERSK